MYMMHQMKSSFPFILILYDMFANVKNVESTEKMTSSLPPTVNPKMWTSMVPEVDIADSIHLNIIQKVKIKLGATNILDREQFSRKNMMVPKFTMPAARHGPFFEDGNVASNVTIRIGSNLELDCKVGLLGDRTVTWHRVRNESFDLLSLGRFTHHKDERINLAFRYPNNYRLKISFVTKRDEGLYECQIATHPVLVRKTYVKIIAPMVRIMDESGHEVSERYYRVGSTLLLTCCATKIGLTRKDEPNKNILGWTHGDAVLHKYSSLNISTEQDLAISTLRITPLDRKHSGNYSCSVGGQAEAFVTVHVLYGELPAAVQTAGVRPFATASTSIMLVLLCSLSVIMR